MANFVESSKMNWVPSEGGNPSSNQLIVGCLQRIATATELMAKNYQSLLNDRDYYKKRLEAEVAACVRLNHRNAALRGHLRRCKNGLKNA